MRSKVQGVWGTDFAYKAGAEARDMNKDKVAPGGLGAQRRSYWLAGWNDRDIELQVFLRKKLDAHREAFPEISRAFAQALINDPLVGAPAQVYIRNVTTKDGKS